MAKDSSWGAGAEDGTRASFRWERDSGRTESLATLLVHSWHDEDRAAAELCRAAGAGDLERVAELLASGEATAEDANGAGESRMPARKPSARAILLHQNTFNEINDTESPSKNRL